MLFLKVLFLVYCWSMFDNQTSYYNRQLCFSNFSTKILSRYAKVLKFTYVNFNSLKSLFHHTQECTCFEKTKNTNWVFNTMSISKNSMVFKTSMAWGNWNIDLKIFSAYTYMLMQIFLIVKVNSIHFSYSFWYTDSVWFSWFKHFCCFI